MIDLFRPNEASVWQELAEHRRSVDNLSIADQFSQDHDRYRKMHVSGAGLILDYSKNLVTEKTLDLLVEAAGCMDLAGKIHSLFSGDNINTTENRPALHTALRSIDGKSPCQADVKDALDRMSTIVTRVHSGDWRGSTGKPITDVINIGIGGSHLGPMMITDALQDYRHAQIRSHFVSNIDRRDLDGVLQKLDPETSLFVICSKSFTTLETLQNGVTARQWLRDRLADKNPDLSPHFLAVSANTGLAKEFGIPEENILPMWDWVGGRYSLWSTAGVSIALSLGMDAFDAVRKGGAAMDRHFRESPFRQNLPVLLGLLGIWYINYWNAGSHAVLPYCQRLRYFPEYLQQLEMESNGKQTRLDNSRTDYATAPVIWGTVETNGQHSFHQLLHQGKGLIPVDFILDLTGTGDTQHHPHVVANCLAQANALMTGKPSDAARAELVARGLTDSAASGLAPHLQMPGNRPSTLLLLDEVNPHTLGALTALYEHKVFVQSVIWNINAFDQYGVELGKQIGRQVHERLTGNTDAPGFDGSTEAVIAMYREKNGGREG